MKKEYPKNGLEYDVIYGKGIYCYLHNNPSIVKFVKRKMNKRFRRKAKDSLKNLLLSNTG